MTKRSMTALRRKFDEAYTKGKQDGKTEVWNLGMSPGGHLLKDGGTAHIQLRSAGCRNAVAADFEIEPEIEV